LATDERRFLGARLAYTDIVNDVRALLADYPVVTTIPLLWGDEDAFGHVNNLIYLRWCESARVDYMRRAGIWVELPPAGTGPILASVKCDYKMQLTYPDTVGVGSRIGAIRNSSFRMEHIVVSHNLGGVAAVVDSTLVWFDYGSRRSVTVPEQIRRVIADLEGKP
jgi:acyl-CoA thioester hydrolase